LIHSPAIAQTFVDDRPKRACRSGIAGCGPEDVGALLPTVGDAIPSDPLCSHPPGRGPVPGTDTHTVDNAAESDPRVTTTSQDRGQDAADGGANDHIQQAIWNHLQTHSARWFTILATRRAVRSLCMIRSRVTPIPE
jgi:hypothetical protein